MTIAYHGCPCGGIATENHRFYKNRAVMLSYFNRGDEANVLSHSRQFLIDNGAFSFWKRNGEASDEYWDQFFTWLNGGILRHPVCDGYLVPDTITGTLDQNKRLLYKYGQHPMAIPVWHYHEPIEWLVSLCENKAFKMVALGSSAEYSRILSPEWLARTDQVFDAITDCNGLPIKPIHGLRMLDSRVTTRYPFRSCDSVNSVFNARHTSRFGMYKSSSAVVRACQIADILEESLGCRQWTPSVQMEFQLSSCVNG